MIMLSLTDSRAFSPAASQRLGGRLRPFDPNDAPTTRLDSGALHTLENGKPYKTSHENDSRRVLVVQDVKAPKDVVLGRIMDYDNYSNMVPQTLESETYRRISEDGRETIFSRLRTGMRGFALEFFVKSTFHPTHSSVTWTLDYDKQSDIEDACGHWYVQAHPKSPESMSRVFYSVDMVMGPSVPKVVGNFINKKAATEATGWVKRFSELQMATA